MPHRRLHNGVRSSLTHLGARVMAALQVISRFMMSVLKLTGTQSVDGNPPLKPVRSVPAVIWCDCSWERAFKESDRIDLQRFQPGENDSSFSKDNFKSNIAAISLSQRSWSAIRGPWGQMGCKGFDGLKAVIQSKPMCHQGRYGL